jgi:hypothetical protein
MLFLANWYWAGTPADVAPRAQAISGPSATERTIHIQSERRWPDRIVFDTTMPTIVPPPAPVAAATPAPAAPVVATSTEGTSPLDARAEIKPSVQPAAPPPKRQAKVRHRNSRPDSGQPPPPAFASANPMARSWPFGW